MKTLRPCLPFALVLAASLPLRAQETVEVGIATFQLFTPRPVPHERLNDLCNSPVLASAVHQVLFGKAAAAPMAAVEGHFFDEGDAGTFFGVRIQAQVEPAVAAAKREEAVQTVATFLQQRLDELVRVRPLQATQKRLAELEAQAEQHEQRYVQLRQELFASARNDVDGVATMVADLDKQRLGLELDLRTELAVHEQLLEQNAELEARHQKLREESRQRSAKRLEVERRLHSLRAAAGVGSAPAAKVDATAVQNLEAAEQELTAAANAQQDFAEEVKRTAARLERVQSELQSAAANVNRMKPRLKIVTDALAEQRKRLEVAETLAARHELASARLDEARNRWEALRSRAEELRGRLEESEPVRLELWR